MRIDAQTHFMPSRIFKKLIDSGYPDIGKRMREVPCIYDIDERRRVIDTFKDYRQVISYAMPPLENLTKGDGKQVAENAKLINEEFVELCAQNPDHFAGWIAQAALGSPDAGVAEAERAIKDGALGVQIYTNVAGKPLDDPAYEPFFAKMNELNKPIWLHPARGATTPDYASETKSRFEIWWTFGWSYETAAAMARLVFGKIMDKYPNLKIITHHFGGIVPMVEGRIGPGWDQIGARTSDEDLGALSRSLKRGRPLDYFKHAFYADTATFTSKIGMDAGFAFFDLDKIVFASDCPFDPEKGTMYTRDTLRLIEERDMPKADKDKVWFGNLERITGVTFKK
jgi:predicted TIM-barrel fold metal-dependent hydrolase